MCFGGEGDPITYEHLIPPEQRQFRKFLYNYLGPQIGQKQKPYPGQMMVDSKDNPLMRMGRGIMGSMYRRAGAPKWPQGRPDPYGYEAGGGVPSKRPKPFPGYETYDPTILDQPPLGGGGYVEEEDPDKTIGGHDIGSSSYEATARKYLPTGLFSSENVPRPSHQWTGWDEDVRGLVGAEDEWRRSEKWPGHTVWSPQVGWQNYRDVQQMYKGGGGVGDMTPYWTAADYYKSR